MKNFSVVYIKVFIHIAHKIISSVSQSLKILVFGSASKSFNSEWKSQSFSFCDLPDLEYGIVQIKVNSTSHFQPRTDITLYFLPRKDLGKYHFIFSAYFYVEN